MIFWVDAQLSPQLAPWLTAQFAVQAQSLRHLGMQRAKDREIFFAARAADAVVITKDAVSYACSKPMGRRPGCSG